MVESFRADGAVTGGSNVPSMTAPVSLYRDPAVFAREREVIFAKSWQFLGLEADLESAGDYLAGSLAGYPVMVVKDAAGQLRGFHNVCPHRAGPLAGEESGHCDRELVCRYHGWRYSFDGRLQNATNFGPASGLNTADYHLFPIRAEAWRGFVFVNLDLSAAPLADALRPLEAQFGGASRRLSARMTHSHKVACNWKVFVENYLEGYHLEGVHPGLEADVHAGRGELIIEGDVVRHDVAANHGDTGGLWAWVWPNLGFSLFRGVLQVEQIRPESPDTFTLRHLYLYEPEDPGIDAATLTNERISEEDAWICEKVQENLDAGVYRQGPLSPSHEAAVAWFQDRVARLIGG
jgi:choline monooxygenase